MLYQAHDLFKHRIHAVDGEIGRVHDLFFDDRHWTIRYLVADTRHWLPARRVLLSPIVVSRVEPAEHAVHVGLSMEQIRSSPDVDTDRPVSRQYEVELHDYFGWPYYWVGAFLWGLASLPTARRTPPAAMENSPPPRERAISTPGRQVPGPGDPHLRSARFVTGLHVQGLDGEIGHAADLLVDALSWAIRYIVVRTGSWWPGKHVLVAPASIGWVSWIELAVHVNLDRATIRQRPAYEPSLALSRDDGTCLAHDR